MDKQATQPEGPEVVVVPPSAQGEKGDAEQTMAAVQEPAKIMRIGTMVRQLLDEVRHAPLDEPSRTRLREIFDSSVEELSGVLAPDLKEELKRLSLPFDEETPSDAELRIAHAQLVGWLEGLFHGIQAMLFAQQVENQARLQELRRGLPQGEPRSGEGTYL